MTLDDLVAYALERRLGPPIDAPAMTPQATRLGSAPKPAIPKNPGRRDLGLKATLLFPDREIVEHVLRAAHLHGLPDLLLAS